MRCRAVIAAAAVVLVVLAPPPANAAVVWDGDPAKGTGVFGNLECVKPGSIVPARQSDGTVVWRYTKAGSDDGPNGGSGNGTQNYPVILNIRNNEARLSTSPPARSGA